MTTSIFDYFEQYKKIYDNKNTFSFTKGKLLDNLDSEISSIKSNNYKLIKDLNKLSLKKNTKQSNDEKLVFDGDYFKLTVYQYNKNENDLGNHINLNMINKHYLFYNNNGFNSGIVGTILNLDASQNQLEDFINEHNIKNFFESNKIYSFQFTEKFHPIIKIDDLNEKEKINVFLQLLYNIDKLYSIYDDLILNFDSLDQIQVYKLDQEITYIYNNNKKYKSKYILKLLDLSTSEIDKKKLRNEKVSIKRNEDIKNLVKLFNIPEVLDVPEYKKSSNIKDILNYYLKETTEISDISGSDKSLFRNISNEKNLIKKENKFGKYLNEVTGKRFIGGAKKKTKKSSKSKKSKKKTKKKSKRSKKLNDSISLNSYKEVSLEKTKNILDDDFSLEDSSELMKNNFSDKKQDEFLNDDFSLEDSSEMKFSKKSSKSNKKIESEDSIDITDDDDDLKFNDDEDSVLLKDDKQLDISDETDNNIMDDMSSELDVIQPSKNNFHDKNQGNAISKLFNTNPNTLVHPSSVHQQALNNEYADSEMSQMYSQNSMVQQQNLMNPNMMQQSNMVDPRLMQNSMQYPTNQVDPNLMQNPNMIDPNLMQNSMQYPNMINPNLMQNNMQYPNMVDPSLMQNNMQYPNMVDPSLMQNNMQYPNMVNPNLMQNMQYPTNQIDAQYSNENDDILSPTMLKNQIGNNNFNIPPQHAFVNQYLNQANHFNAPMNGLVGGAKKKKNKHKKMKEVKD